VKKTKTKKVLSQGELEFNLTLQHYRGRNEHSVSECVNGKEALCTAWRGSYSLICAITKLTVHMTTLQERMKGPKYDVYGPWPHFPNAGAPQATPPAAASSSHPAAPASKPHVGEVWFVPARLWPRLTPGRTAHGSGWLGHILRLKPGPSPSVLFRCEGETSVAEMCMKAFATDCIFVRAAAAPLVAPPPKPLRKQGAVRMRVTASLRKRVFEVCHLLLSSWHFLLLVHSLVLPPHPVLSGVPSCARSLPTACAHHYGCQNLLAALLSLQDSVAERFSSFSPVATAHSWLRLVHGWPRLLPTATHGYPRLPTAAHGYPRLPTATHGYPRLPTAHTASHGYPRLPTATHGWARLGWAGLGWV
jgi:hypothetical protein